MKKDLFWRIMAVLLFVWLCVWFWSQNINVYDYPAETGIGGVAFIKMNKITGSVKVNIVYKGLKKKSSWYAPETVKSEKE